MRGSGANAEDAGRTSDPKSFGVNVLVANREVLGGFLGYFLQ